MSRDQSRLTPKDIESITSGKIEPQLLSKLHHLARTPDIIVRPVYYVKPSHELSGSTQLFTELLLGKKGRSLQSQWKHHVDRIHSRRPLTTWTPAETQRLIDTVIVSAPPGQWDSFNWAHIASCMRKSEAECIEQWERELIPAFQHWIKLVFLDTRR
ncbi:hypothetical protein BDB01DRAFT_839406 [Pilobolus umbonatus]|nr:hypothetical protein BDB01DRAFT_839406 [Pilobolus umbonatus]